MRGLYINILFNTFLFNNFNNFCTNPISIRKIIIENNVETENLNIEIYNDADTEKKLDIKTDILDKLTDTKYKEYYLDKIDIEINNIEDEKKKKTIYITDDTTTINTDTDVNIDLYFKKYVNISKIEISIFNNTYKLEKDVKFKQDISLDFLKKYIKDNEKIFEDKDKKLLSSLGINIDDYFLSTFTVNNEKLDISEKIDLKDKKDKTNNNISAKLEKYYNIDLKLVYKNEEKPLNNIKIQTYNIENYINLQSLIKKQLTEFENKNGNKTLFNGFQSTEYFHIKDIEFNKQNYKKYYLDDIYTNLKNYIESNTTSPTVLKVVFDKTIGLNITIQDKEKLSFDQSALKKIENTKLWNLISLQDLLYNIKEELKSEDITDLQIYFKTENDEYAMEVNKSRLLLDGEDIKLCFTGHKKEEKTKEKEEKEGNGTTTKQIQCSSYNKDKDR